MNHDNPIRDRNPAKVTLIVEHVDGRVLTFASDHVLTFVMVQWEGEQTAVDANLYGCTVVQRQKEPE